MEIVRTSFDIPKALLKNFKGTCVDLDVTMSEVIREIMNKWLIVQENKKEVK